MKTFDVSAGRILAEFHADTRAAGYVAGFSRDRRLVALGCEDGAVKIFHTDPFQEIQTLEAHTGEIANLAFGAGDQRLASTGNDLGVKVWECCSDTPLREAPNALSSGRYSSRSSPL